MHHGTRIGSTTLLLLSVLLGAAPTAAVGQGEPHLHLLLLNAEGFRLEPFRLADGESTVLTIDRGSDLVDLVYAVGPGQSGNLVQRSAERYTLDVRRQGDTYLLGVGKGNGASRVLPPIHIADLGTYRIRLSATAADGRKAAFVIENGIRVLRDENGPVVDMFRGMIPMAPGDVSPRDPSGPQKRPRASVYILQRVIRGVAKRFR